MVMILSVSRCVQAKKTFETKLVWKRTRRGARATTLREGDACHDSALNFTSSHCCDIQQPNKRLHCTSNTQTCRRLHHEDRSENPHLQHPFGQAETVSSRQVVQQPPSLNPHRSPLNHHLCSFALRPRAATVCNPTGRMASMLARLYARPPPPTAPLEPESNL